MNVADMGLMRPQVYDCYYEGLRSRCMCKDVCQCGAVESCWKWANECVLQSECEGES